LPTKIKNSPLRTLKRTKDFDLVNRKGKSFQGYFVRLIVLQQKNSTNEKPVQTQKLGITISKKIHKHAVLRNKFRRRIKELFRTTLRTHFKNYSVHIIARPGSEKATSAELLADITKLLNKFNPLNQE